jgi:hypothetical protein
MPVDHFPSTHATWIDAQLTIVERAGVHTEHGQSAQHALRQYLMQRYHSALRAYVTRSSLRSITEPDDLIGGFFAERACKSDFLNSWRQSGLPLRRWMMTGINLYGKSIIRNQTRDRLRSADNIDLENGGLTDESSAEQAFERAWALAVLNAALLRVHADLAAASRLEDFWIFRRRVIQGESYDSIAPSVGRSPQQCAGATRLVTDRLREALRSALSEEGVSDRDIGVSITDVYRAFGINKRVDDQN